MKSRSAKRGGCRSAEWNWGAPKDGGLRSAEWNRGKSIQAERSTDGIEECLSQRRSAKKGWREECGMHYRSAGGNWRAPIPARGTQIGGGLECGMGYRSAERRNWLWNQIGEVQSRLRSSDKDWGAHILVELCHRGGGDAGVIWQLMCDWLCSNF